MQSLIALKAVIGMVPQWYEAEFGKWDYSLSAGADVLSFHSHRPLTPALTEFLNRAHAELPDLVDVAESLSPSAAIAFIQEYFAIVWLKHKSPGVNWEKLINYSSQLAYRTYENEPISRNLIISNGEAIMSIDEPDVQRIFDPLATSPHSYVRVNYEINFVSYQEIPWEDVKDTKDYKFFPEFLQPVASTLKPGEYSVYQTGRGDLVIMSTSGLLAAKRKGRWKIYDVYTFKNSIVDAITNTLPAGSQSYRVGCNLFDIMFDLSFRRHGALLVYDPSESVLPHVVNKGSILKPEFADAARIALLPSVRDIAMGKAEFSARKKRLFLELASVDGALLFTKTRVLAVGAIIESHPQANLEVGARSTAARSAMQWGGFPVKVSADGEISIYFRSVSKRGQTSCAASFEFL